MRFPTCPRLYIQYTSGMANRKFRFESALVSGRWQDDVCVAVDDDGMIAAIEANSRDGAPIKGAAVAAMPNVHSHAHQRLMAGLAEKAGPGADSFWTWREVMYQFALKLSPDDLEAVAAQGYVEMLKAGFSAVGEFQYLHHQPDGRPYDDIAEMSVRCLAAADQAGIAITILPALYAFGGFGGQAPGERQRRFISTQDQFFSIYGELHKLCSDHPLRRLGVAPHSLRAVTPELLKSVLTVIDPRVIHMHVAEQQREVEECVAWSGARPVELLFREFEVGEHWCIVHATHLDEDEFNELASSHAIAGLCPITEANLGDGIFPAREYKRSGGLLAIGSDSNVIISGAEELRQLEYSQRLKHLSRNVLGTEADQSTGRFLRGDIIYGGSLALAQHMGLLAEGRRCDITVLDTEHPAMIGRRGDDLIDSWIFAGGNAVVKDTIVGGTHVVKDRWHFDEDRILKRYAETVRRLA
jgi:formimidoylglutamate deiminase